MDGLRTPPTIAVDAISTGLQVGVSVGLITEFEYIIRRNLKQLKYQI